MRLLPKLPSGIHPLRKLSIIWVFCIVGMVLLQEHLDPESLKHYGLYLRIGTYCCAAFLFISLLIVRKYEKNQWEELDEKQQKLRKFNEEARAASENNLPQEESK